MGAHYVVPRIHFGVGTGELDVNQRLAAMHAVAAELSEIDPDSAIRTSWIYGSELCPVDEDWIVAEDDIRRILTTELARFNTPTTKYEIDTQNLNGYQYKYVDGMILCCRGFQVLENGQLKQIKVPGVGEVMLHIVFEAAGPVG